MVELPDARALALLTRAPSSGGKTRLFASLGITPDPRLLEALLLDTVAGASAPGVRLVVVVTPPSACDEIRETLARHACTDLVEDVLPQADGDLGDRMRAAMVHLFSRGASAVALVGSDLPHITASHVVAAFDEIARDRNALVLGPAGDGGYYLIAASREPEVFEGMEWGSSRVLAETQRAAAAKGFTVRLLPTLDDVDTPEDLWRAVSSGHAPRTAGWVGALRHK
jgi:rSAM/selenodomain-associated transferase 1